MSVKINGNTGITNVNGTAASPALTGADTDTGVFTGSDIVGISTGGSERVRVDASGNVGIGTSSPDRLFHLVSSGTTTPMRIDSGGSSASLIDFKDTATTADFKVRVGSTGDNFVAYAGGSERMRIDSSGNLLVGTTTATGKVTISDNSNIKPLLRFDDTNGTSNQFTIIDFRRSSTQTGAITITATNTAYNTSSDYRLKENVVPMTGALDKVQALNPVTYTWKVDGSAGQGFIAHELQAVCPDAVSGEKDAVEIVDEFDDDGNKIGTKEVPQYQGVDTSFLVGILTAAIKELKTELDAAKARIEQLEQA